MSSEGAVECMVEKNKGKWFEESEVSHFLHWVLHDSSDHFDWWRHSFIYISFIIF